MIIVAHVSCLQQQLVPLMYFDSVLLCVFIFRRRHAPPGPHPGVVEGEERQLLFAPHPGARLRQLAAVGEGGQEGGGRLRGGAGSDARQSDGRGAAGPPAARRLHLPVGGVQLQLEQQHPVVGAGKGGLGRLRHLQTLGRLHAAPAYRKRPDQPLEHVLSPGDLPRGAVSAVVWQPQPAVDLRRLPAMPQESQTQLVSSGDTGHWPRFQTGQILETQTGLFCTCTVYSTHTSF